MVWLITVEYEDGFEFYTETYTAEEWENLITDYPDEAAFLEDHNAIIVGGI